MGPEPAPGPAAVEASASRPRRASGYAAARRQQVLDSRDRHRSLDVVLSATEDDLAIGGSLIAGALAFRLFLWSLPACLVLAGIAGFRAGSADQDARALGIPA